MMSEMFGEDGPNQWFPKMMAANMEAWGYGNRKVIMVIDGEPAMLKLKREIISFRQAEAVPEEVSRG